MKTDKEIIILTELKVHEFYSRLDDEVRGHLIYMLNEIEFMYDTRKANRWLGFIHGTLVALTDCTVEELRNMIREED